MPFFAFKEFLVGKPLRNEEISQEKLPKWKALAIFSSDALSSVAYGPEQIMLVLAIPGVLAYGYIAPVAAGILLLLALTTLSYVQVAKANPGGGGSYAVAKQNLGEIPALLAAAALFTDYSLTAAVSVSAGTEAIVSAFPFLQSYEVGLDLVVLFGILMWINLRGVRESSTAFVFPTYSFIFGVLALTAVGSWQAFTQAGPVIPHESLETQWNWAILFLVLRAFANGCSSMTGIEAISNGVPMFKEPEVKNATQTTFIMSSLLGVMFAGITFLLIHNHILPLDGITALSQLAEMTFGRSWAYYYIQITTMLVLYLAANTAFNGLPPLLSLMARDGYMPRYLSARGVRLGFSNGIILLTVVSSLLIYFYHGNTEELISLYAIGVFISFTIAQAGMVVHWQREKGAGYGLRILLNGFGAVITGSVVIIIMVTKFFYGAWLVFILIPILIFIFKKISCHYEDMREQLAVEAQGVQFPYQSPKLAENIVIVPVSGVTRVVEGTLAYAQTIGSKVIAVYVATDQETKEKFTAKWNNWNPGVELVVLYSPYRVILDPLMRYIEELDQKKRSQDYLTVLIPEFETKKWWHRFLHNQTGWILRTLLILREKVVVSTIPYHLRK